MRFALEKINNDSQIIRGFEISPIIVDATELGYTIGSKMTPGYNFGTMPMAIGPMLSADAYDLSSISHYPLISYYASFDKAENSETCSERSYFYRSVPTDTFKIHAILQVIKALKWRHVVIISSYDKNGATMAKEFIANFQEIHYSVSKHEEISRYPTEFEYEQIVRYMSEDKGSRALVLFTTTDDSAGVLRALKRANLTERFQILAANGFTNYVEVTSGNEEVAEGSISIEYATEEIPEFREYFLKLNPKIRNSTAFKIFWEQTFQCTLTPHTNSSVPACTLQEKLKQGKGYYSNTPVHLVISAVYSMAYSIKHVIEIMCANSSSYCNINPYVTIFKVRDYLKSHCFPDLTLNLTNPFVTESPYHVKYDILNYVKAKEGYKNTKIGRWSTKWGSVFLLPGMNYHERHSKSDFQINVTQIKFKVQTGLIMSNCSLPCNSGEYYVPETYFKQLNCWYCRKCQSRHIIVNNTCVQCPPCHIIVNNTCVQCSEGYKPDPKYRICVRNPTKYLNIEDNMVMPISLVLSAVGFILTGISTSVFLKHNNSKIVKASGRDLSYFMLAGIALIFIIPVLFITKPNWILCALRSIFPGLAFAICYASLFLKTNRMYRIFRYSKKFVSEVHLVSPRSQILILAGIIGMQAVLGVVWIIRKYPEVQKYTLKGCELTVYHCGNDPTPFMVNLIISVIAMTGSTWMAFKTRNLPANFNEAKYIGVTLYITCILWALFLPSYFIVKEDESFTRGLMIVFTFILIGYTTLIGLFGQKIRLLLFPVSSNTNLVVRPAFDLFKIEENGANLQLHSS